MDYRELKKLNKDYLDTLDLDRYVNASNDVQIIIDMIEYDYDNKECLPQELERCIFNYLDTEDVAHYLADRYNKHVVEQVYNYYTLHE